VPFIIKFINKYIDKTRIIFSRGGNRYATFEIERYGEIDYTQKYPTLKVSVNDNFFTLRLTSTDIIEPKRKYQFPLFLVFIRLISVKYILKKLELLKMNRFWM
jgi:hypothetical protein